MELKMAFEDIIDLHLGEGTAASMSTVPGGSMSSSTQSVGPFDRQDKLDGDDIEDVDDFIGGDSGTHYKTTTSIGEQEVTAPPPEEMEAPPEDIPADNPVPPPINAPPPMDSAEANPAALPGDPAAAGMDPSMGGMGGMPGEGPQTPGEVGRIYELKKIHSRLVSVQSYLSTSTDVNLIKLRDRVFEAVELFRTMISNIDLFKDKLDTIIVMFYKFLDQTYITLSKFYKNKDTGADVRIPD